jgi:hypothetical protein
VLAACNTRAGAVSAYLCRRKRQVEILPLLDLLDLLDSQGEATITTVHLVWDNVSTHNGDPSQTWRAAHPRFGMHSTPVQSAGMNQIAQWVSILARKRLGMPNFAHRPALAVARTNFIDDWNAPCHPFHWTATSCDPVIAKVEQALGLTADRAAA